MGVAKIQDDQGKTLNNVPFNVRTKAELDVFVANLLSTQTEFSGVDDGEYVPNAIPVKEVDPVQEALDSVYRAERNLGLGIITQPEYDAVVAAYKVIASAK